MTKIYLNDVSNLTGNPTAAEQIINDNMDTLEQAFDNTLSRDGTTPNYMDSELDMNSHRIINLGAPSNPTDAARLKDITSALTIDDLLVPPLDGNEDKYLGTDGNDLVFKDFPEDASSLPEFPMTQKETALGITVVDYSYPPLNVLRYGAIPNGTEVNAPENNTAFQALFTYLATYGGEGIIPEGTYWLSQIIVFDGGDGLLNGEITPNASIRAYGAQIKNTSAMVGGAFKFINIYTPRLVSICGLLVNHRWNSTATGAIRLQNTANVTIEDCVFETNNNSADYSAIWVGPKTSGDENTNCFWTKIEKCVFRPLAGTEPGYLPPRYCIRLVGGVNDTLIRDCNFSTGVYGIQLQTDNVDLNRLPGDVTIEDNNFEGVNTAIRVLTYPKQDGGYWPSGLKVLSNRFEAVNVGTSYEFNKEGAEYVEAYNHSTPPYYAHNWTDGTVTTWIYNPWQAYITTLESRYYGDTPGNLDYSNVGRQVEYIAGSKILKFGDHGNLEIKNFSNVSNYVEGHLVFGNRHLWFDTTTEKFYHKNGVPTSATDGVALGTGTSGGDGTTADILDGNGIFGVSNDYIVEGTQGNVLFRWSKAGKSVTIQMDGLLNATVKGTRLVIGSLPDAIRPLTFQRWVGICIEDNVYSPCAMEIDPNFPFIYVYRDVGSNYFGLNKPNSGFPAQTFTYSLVT